MVKVTYHDLDRAAPYVSFHGVPFQNGIPVEVDEEEHKDLLAAVEGHRFFEVKRGDTPKPPKEEKPKEEPHAKTPAKPQPKPEQPKAVQAKPAQLKPAPKPVDDVTGAERKGSQAYQEGRDRYAPPRYKGTERQAWLKGYDKAKASRPAPSRPVPHRGRK